MSGNDELMRFGCLVKSIRSLMYPNVCVFALSKPCGIPHKHDKQWNLRVDPQQSFFSNYCHGILGLAQVGLRTIYRYTYTRRSFQGQPFLFRTLPRRVLFLFLFLFVFPSLSLCPLAGDQQSWISGYWQLGLGTLRLRYLGRQPAILDFRLLAAGLS